MDYKGPDNIYWLFSSSAQAIAAFIGFLTAGFYFVLDKMDDQVLRDSTLDEINQEIKRSHFKKLKVLCVLTGASILLSLGLVFTNGFDYCLKTISVIIVSLINITTITWAIVFVIGIIDPDNINKAAKKLIKESKDLFGAENGDIKDSIKIGDFIERFVQLEKIIRELDMRFELSYYLRDKYKNFTPLNELFKIMLQRELIDNQTLRDLHEVNKVRNLAAHGQIDRVDVRIGNMLSELMIKFENRLKENN